MYGAFVMCALAPLTVADAPKEKPFKPTAVFRGSHSLIKKERFVQVLTDDAWKKLWEEHRGKANHFTESGQELEINFQTHYVVAISTGHCDWCSVNSRTRGNVLHLGFEDGVNQTEGGPPKLTTEEQARRDAVSPNAIIILPVSVRSVVIEQDVRSLLAGPPLWKLRTQFPAPSEK